MIEIGKLGTVAHEMKKIAQPRAEIVSVAGPVFAVDGDFSDGEMLAGIPGKEAAVGIATHHSFALRSFIQGADPMSGLARCSPNWVLVMRPIWTT